MVINIKDNAICEIDAKKRLNILNIIKNSEIKHKRLNSGKKRIKWLFRWNNWQIKIIWRPNRIIKKVENLEEYYFINDFGDKELKFKIFKLRLAHLSNEIDEDLFTQIFDHKFETLVDKLINTTNREENQIIIKNILKSKDKLFQIDKFNDWVNKPSNQCIKLKDSIDLILDFNEEPN